MSTVGKGMTAAFTLPLVGLGVAAFKSANTIDEAMDDIRASTGATGDALEGLGKDFEAVFKRTPAAAADVATALSKIHSVTGLTGKSLQDLTQVTLELARLQKTDLNTTLANTTRLFGDWGIETGKEVEALDKLFKVSQATGQKVDDLAGNLVKFGAPLRQLGFDIDEAAAVMAKFQKEGVNTELVMGSLRIALGKLSKEQVKDLPAAFKALQKSIAEAGSSAEGNAKAFKAFGARAGADLAAALREGRFSVEDLMAAVDASNETVLGAAKDTESFAEKWILVKNNLTIALKPLGIRLLEVFEKLQPHLIKAVERVAALAEKFAALDPQVQGAVLAFLGILAVVGPTLFAASKMIRAYTDIKIAVLAASKALSVFGGASAGAGAAGAAASPLVVGLAGAFAGLAATAYEVKRQVEGQAGPWEKLFFSMTPATSLAELMIDRNERLAKSAERWNNVLGGTSTTAAEVVDIETQLAQWTAEVDKASADAALSQEELEKSLGKTGKTAKEVKDKFVELVLGLQAQQREINLTDREMLEWELTQAGASETQRGLALAIFDTNKSLELNKQEAEEAAAQQKEWNKQLNEMHGALDAEIKQLKGASKEVRIYDLMQQGATRTEAKAIIAKEAFVRALIHQQEAFAAAVAKAVNENNQKMEEMRDTALRVANDISGGFIDRIKGAFEGLSTLSEKVFGGGADGLLSKLGGFGKGLLAAAGPAGAIFGAVDAIGNLFGINLSGMVGKALSKMGGAIVGFFKKFGHIFGKHTTLTEKEQEIFGFDVSGTGEKFTDSFQRADAKIDALTEEMRRAVIAIVSAAEEGVISLGDEDWRAVAEAAQTIAQEGGTVADLLKKFGLDLPADELAELGDTVEEFTDELAGALPSPSDAGGSVPSLGLGDAGIPVAVAGVGSGFAGQIIVENTFILDGRKLVDFVEERVVSRIYTKTGLINK